MLFQMVVMQLSNLELAPRDNQSTNTIIDSSTRNAIANLGHGRGSKHQGADSFVSYKNLFLRIMLLVLVSNADYTWCAWFTTFFYSEQSKALISFSIFIFLGVTGFISFLFRLAGNFIDRALGSHCYSMNMIGSIMADCFLIIYQRNLFSLVDTWFNFAIVTIFCALFEILVYSFSVTKTYEKFHDSLMRYARRHRDALDISAVDWSGSVIITNIVHFRTDKILPQLAIIYAICHRWQDGRIFVHRNALMISYRIMIRISSSIAYIIFTTFLRFGYNAQFYEDASSLSIDDFKLLMTFIVISVIIDIIVVLPTDYYLRKTTNIGLASRFVSYFAISDQPEYFIFMIWAITHITTDVFIAKVQVSKFS